MSDKNGWISIDADRSAAHAKAHAEDMYQRALKAEEAEARNE